jgi:putative hydrolase of the HAD superfamily
MSKKQTRQFRCLVFDLDDTLLDTNGKMVPGATKLSCEAMLAAGLNVSLEECISERMRFHHENPRGDVFRFLAEKYGPIEKAEKIAQAGFKAFYHREIEANAIALFDGVKEMLERLSYLYPLYLVTSGFESTQQQKVRLSGIERFFKRIHYVDLGRGDTKLAAYRAIFKDEGGAPQEYLAIGNRVDTDLQPAKLLGWQTCWLRVGEYAHLFPNGDELPDYEIQRIGDLTEKCQL